MSWSDSDLDLNSLVNVILPLDLYKQIPFTSEQNFDDLLALIRRALLGSDSKNDDAGRRSVSMSVNPHAMRQLVFGMCETLAGGDPGSRLWLLPQVLERLTRWRISSVEERFAPERLRELVVDLAGLANCSQSMSSNIQSSSPTRLRIRWTSREYFEEQEVSSKGRQAYPILDTTTDLSRPFLNRIDFAAASVDVSGTDSSPSVGPEAQTSPHDQSSVFPVLDLSGSSAIQLSDIRVNIPPMNPTREPVIDENTPPLPDLVRNPPPSRSTTSARPRRQPSSAIVTTSSSSVQATPSFSSKLPHKYALRSSSRTAKVSSAIEPASSGTSTKIPAPSRSSSRSALQSSSSVNTESRLTSATLSSSRKANSAVIASSSSRTSTTALLHPPAKTPKIEARPTKSSLSGSTLIQTRKTTKPMANSAAAKMAKVQTKPNTTSANGLTGAKVPKMAKVGTKPNANPVSGAKILGTSKSSTTVAVATAKSSNAKVTSKATSTRSVKTTSAAPPGTRAVLGQRNMAD